MTTATAQLCGHRWPQTTAADHLADEPTTRCRCRCGATTRSPR